MGNDGCPGVQVEENRATDRDLTSAPKMEPLTGPIFSLSGSDGLGVQELHRDAERAGVAERAKITRSSSGGTAGRFSGLSESLPPAGRRPTCTCADDRDRVEIEPITVRGAHPDGNHWSGLVTQPKLDKGTTTAEMAGSGILDRSDIHCRRKNTKALPQGRAAFASPFDDFPRPGSAAESFRAESGPVRDPFRLHRAGMIW